MKDKFKVYFSLCLIFIVLPLYIMLYRENTTLFWILFVLERGVYLLLGEGVFNSIEKIIKKEEESSSILGLCIGSVIYGIAMLIWIFINYRKIFFILIIGEILDGIILGVRKLVKRKA